MKKTICILLVLALSLSLLCGCGNGKASLADLFRSGRDSARPICAFEDMAYERPDLEAMEAKADEIVELLEKDARYRKVTRLLDQLYELYYSADTMYTLADIRNCQDLTDEYYAQEYAWFAAVMPEIGRVMERVYLACGSSTLAEKLEKDYFWEGFLDDYGPDSESMYTDAYIALAARESELVSIYRATIADPVIEIGGQEYHMSEYLLTADDNESYLAYLAYYDKYNPILGELYIELVAVRREIAEELGYASFAEMQYDQTFDRDFDLEEADAFITAVKDILVPLSLELDQAGVRDEIWYSLLEEEDLYYVLEGVAKGLGGDAKEAWTFMDRYHLSDLRISGDKPDMSFQTYLSDYEAPFLFVSPSGDTEDIITVTHEFGHYVDSFVTYNRMRSIDLAECFSQAMQFLSLDAMGDVLTDEAVENLRRMNLVDILDTYVQQISFADFERQVFANEDLTVEWINDLSLRMAKEYGYFIPGGEDYYALSWIDVPHFFEQPFYVISYPASAGVALEIYERELARSGDGMDAFEALLEAEDPGLVTAAEEAGLSDPLTWERIADIADFIWAQLMGEELREQSYAA